MARFRLRALHVRFQSEVVRGLLTLAALGSFLYALGAGKKW